MELLLKEKALNGRGQRTSSGFFAVAGGVDCVQFVPRTASLPVFVAAKAPRGCQHAVARGTAELGAG